MRVAKIISVYMGPRRNMNNNFLTENDCIEFLKLQVENEKKNDCGLPMDLIIINNNVHNNIANEYIDSLNDQNIYNGIIRVFHRENIGGSFGAFSYGYDMVCNDYDFFLFNEDDIMITASGYYKRAVDILQQNTNIGFIAFSPISYHEPYHCGGGFGVTSKRVLELVRQQFGALPYHQDNTYFAFENSEIMFTNCIISLGLLLENVPEYSPLALNYEKHTSQNKPQYVTDQNLSKTFIYKVGF